MGRGKVTITTRLHRQAILSPFAKRRPHVRPGNPCPSRGGYPPFLCYFATNTTTNRSPCYLRECTTLAAPTHVSGRRLPGPQLTPAHKKLAGSQSGGEPPTAGKSPGCGTGQTQGSPVPAASIDPTCSSNATTSPPKVPSDTQTGTPKDKAPFTSNHHRCFHQRWASSTSVGLFTPSVPWPLAGSPRPVAAAMVACTSYTSPGVSAYARPIAPGDWQEDDGGWGWLPTLPDRQWSLFFTGSALHRHHPVVIHV